MSEQLTLIPVEAPPLTARQQAILAALETAGHDGIDDEQAGAILHGFKEGRWAHARDARCDWCGRDGKQYLERLRELGLAQYRRARRDRPGAWIATSTGESAGGVARGMLLPDEDLPF